MSSLFLKGVTSGFKLFGHHISSGINCILLIPAYLIGIGATSLIAKLIGKHFLRAKDTSSTWVKREEGKKSYDDFLRGF